MRSFSSMLAAKIPNDRVITSIALGKFDGLHRGHEALLSLLDEYGAVLIIDNDEYGQGDASDDISACYAQNATHEAWWEGHWLTSLYDRLHRLPHAYSVNLRDIAHLSGEEFIAELGRALPYLKRIVVGYDFRFGAYRMYGAEDLQSLCSYEVIIVPKVCYGEVPLHASVIKDLIRHGDISVANAMLGWNYVIAGEVVQGQGLGKRELYPTINMRSYGYVLPANGVYAARLEGYAAVSFFGRRLSTDGIYAIESHIIEEDPSTLERIFDRCDMRNEMSNTCDENSKKHDEVREQVRGADISMMREACNYHIKQECKKSVRLELYRKIRENRKFHTLIALKEQITRDIAEARKILSAAH